MLNISNSSTPTQQASGKRVHGEMLFKRQPAVGTGRRNAFAMRIF
jgi:hypothetical protein